MENALYTLVTPSTFDVEFVTYFEATGQASWLQNFIFVLRFIDTIVDPVSIYCDNSAATRFANDDKYFWQNTSTWMFKISSIKRVQNHLESIEGISMDS